MTDQELLALMPETMRDEFSYAARVCSDATGGKVKPGIFRVALNTAALEYARAVLALATTSEQIPPGPYSEHELRTQWNAQADEFNQWESLDLSEQLAWAQARAIAADRTRATLAQPEPQRPADEKLVKHYDRAVTSAIAIRVAVRALTNEDRDAATVAGLRAVLARWGRPAIEPVPKQEDIHYAWELHDAEGEWQAGGTANSLEDVQREGNRYLQTYSQEGPHKLIIERHCVTTIEPVPGVEGADG